MSRDSVAAMRRNVRPQVREIAGVPRSPWLWFSLAITAFANKFNFKQRCTRRGFCTGESHVVAVASHYTYQQKSCVKDPNGVQR
jgi:hypothetical protein